MILRGANANVLQGFFLSNDKIKEYASHNTSTLTPTYVEAIDVGLELGGLCLNFCANVHHRDEGEENQLGALAIY